MGVILEHNQSEGISLRVTEEEKRSSNIGDRITAFNLRNLFEIESGPGAEFVFKFEIIFKIPFNEKYNYNKKNTLKFYYILNM